MATQEATVPAYVIAADNHNLGNGRLSWADPYAWEQKIGNIGKYAASSILAGTNSIYNSAVTVGNWMGADFQENNTNIWISGMDADLGQYYRQNQASVELGGFIATSLIPGIGGIKIFNAGQKALQVGVNTGKIGGNLAKAAGLLVPKTAMYLDDAATAINASTTTLKLLNANTTKAIASGFYQNVLEAAAFETAVYATMFRSPILQEQDTKDIVYNIAIGGAVGGVIGGAFATAGLFGKLKQAVKAEDAKRLPFIDRPALVANTPASERIIHYTFDSEAAAVPVSIRNAEGTAVVNNFAVNETLYKDKITKNFNDTRLAINDLAGKDKALGNYVASISTPVLKEGKYTPGFAQKYYDEFNGAIGITRPGQQLGVELTVAKQIENGATPDVNLAVRYVKINGDNAGEVLATPPKVATLADAVGNKEAIMKYVRKQGFSNKLDGTDLWDVFKLKGIKNPVAAAQARYIWADSILKQVPKGATIHKYDIPILERAWKDGVYELRVVSGSGPSLETIAIGSKQELYRIIKESKEEAANFLLRDLSLKKTGKVPIEDSEEMIPLITNTRANYLHANPSENEIDDLFAWQSNTARNQKNLESRGISKDTEEYQTESIFQPSYMRVVYDVDNAATEITENVLDGIAWYKMKQRMYVDDAGRVVAKIAGEYAERLPEISDSALIQASRTGSGAGLFSSENSNYGTIGSAMAWIGSVTREMKIAARKKVADELQGSLVALGQKQEAAFEFESINQQVTRSGQQWKRYSIDDEHYLITDRAWKAALDPETKALDFDTVFAEFGEDLISLKNSETISLIDAHIKTSGSRTQNFRDIHAAQGKTDFKNPEFYRPIRPDLKNYPYFVFVKDPAVTGSGHTTMIHAASEKELAALIDKVPNRYQVITKSETEDYYKARSEYEYQRTLNENYINSELSNKGVFSNFFPKSDPAKIVDDVLQQHYRESDTLMMETVRLRYEPQFEFLENLGDQYSKIDTSQFAARRDFIERTSQNPYYNYIKTALDISKIGEYPLIASFNKMLDTAVSKAVGAYQDTFAKAKSPADLEKINAEMDKYGLKPAYYDAALQALANHTAPKGELTKFVRGANALLSQFVLGLDPLNSLNNAIGSNILRMTELRHLTKAIAAGDTEIAGELGRIAKVKLPGVGDEILAPTKLVAKAISNFWSDTSGLARVSGKHTPGPIMQKYKKMGLIKDRVEQLKMLADDFTLTGTETVSELTERMNTAFARGQKLLEAGEDFSRNKLAEEFNRFISANVMDQITEIGIKKGLLDEKSANAYINTFVNRVEGNIISSQRPLVFQGPVGQAISLFQSYQFNLLQQLFRYVAEGSGKDLAMLAGLQSTLYGLQSLPAFQFLNVHILGQLSGNTEHRDTYDAVYGITGKTAGDFLLYGIPSNILQTNIYSRGDINPRHLTILPTTLQEIPIVQGWGKFLANLKDTVKGISGGGDVWETILQGVEHNGISRPLAGFAQTLQAFGPGGQAYSTSSRGSILYENDLMSLATLSRLAGGRPLDEAVVNDAMFRVRTYEAARRQSMLSLGERLKTNLIAGNDVDSEDVERFASRYVELGGKQQNFNRWMMNLHTNANTSQSEQLRASLTDPFSYKVQLLMGGDDE
jgi:hypothetical protein